MRQETLTVTFAVSIAIANVTAAKLAWVDLPIIGGVAVPAGFVAFGVAFLCSDLMVEYYGEDYAHRVVNGTIVALVIAYGLIFSAIQLPTAPFYNDTAYITTLGSSAAIVAASVITLFASQHIDVRIFARLKQATNNEHKWLRNLGSTSLSQGVDTVVFITLGFAVFPYLQGQPALWGAALISTIVGQYIVKLIVAVLDTPLFYLLSR